MNTIFRISKNRSITHQTCLNKTERFIVDDEGGGSTELSAKDLLGLISAATKIRKDAQTELARMSTRR